MGDYLYAERWNGELARPPKGTPWLSLEEATARYAEHSGTVIVIEGTRTGDGALQPKWTLGLGRTGVRVHFRSSHGSIWRAVDYDAREGRLWKWTTDDYRYPDSSRFYDMDECVVRHSSEFEPDGTGYIDINDKSKKLVDRVRFEGAPVQGFWLDWPEFGDWRNLTDPDYGVPPAASTAL